MITRRTKQLFDSARIFPILLPVALLGLFCFSFFTPGAFFPYLAPTLVVSIGYLFVKKARLNAQLSVLSLQRQGYLEKANLIRADIAKDVKAVASIHEKIVAYSYLKSLTEKLSLSFSVAQTSQILTRESIQLFQTKDLAAKMYLFNAKTGKLYLSSSWAKNGAMDVKAKKGDLYDQWVVHNLKPLLVRDTKSDFRFDPDKIGAESLRDVRSLMIVPMMLEDKAIGILRLDSRRENDFGTEDIRLLMTVGYIGAVAIDNAQLYEKAEDLAIHDSLTGLYLRRYFLERLSHEIKRELRRKKELAFLMIDLDRFKQYNDTYGHTAGDIVLKSIGQIISRMFAQPGNTVCRYGGEEFSVLLPDCSKEEALKLAENLRRTIQEQTIVLRRQKTSITVSVGVATFPRDAQIKEELIQRADEAMYRAKNKGRNNVQGA